MFEPILQKSVALAFPDSTRSKIIDLTGSEPEIAADPITLLAMIDPDAASLTEALAAKDATHLPRWGVVIFGTRPLGEAADERVEVLPRTEWDPVHVSRVLRLVSIQHRLTRENSRLREEFLTYGSRISHDLRTPLGGVMTTSEMLREILEEDAPAKASLTQPLLDSADGLVKLIERVGSFAKAIASREAPHSLAMETVFWNAYQKLESKIMKASATFHYPASWPQVWGRASGLETVWYNLILNALVHGGVKVAIEAGWEAVAGGHRFWIVDSGLVPAEKRAALFFPFHRLHESGAPRGLGLPIVRRLVELDGGYCGYKETPEGRSCFYFFLPDAVATAG
jgi:signal transduction histidine kinase